MKYNHITLKLSSGEVIMSRLDSETEIDYVIEYPLALDVYYDSDIATSYLYFKLFNPLGYLYQTQYIIKKSHVMFELDSTEDIEAFYEKFIAKQLQRIEEKLIEEKLNIVNMIKVSNTSIN